MMRIITGSARGAKLQAPAGEHTRPTAERTKEAVFSMLQYSFEGRRVLDLFGGSGQLGLEALSRGAAHATIVDNDKAAVDMIQKNAAHTKLSPRATVLRADALAFLSTYRGEPFHLVFLDPPYATDLVNRALALIAEKNLLAVGGTVVCETGDADAVQGGIGKGRLEVVRRARYGVAHITLLKSVAEEEVL
ncbi:MAG: 16S rRNA (guanine(966)-N(2))-methyltransferase RsmD [Clostridia bacterium]|nr:16S rRNA (guanine(966)-N(2))-methyltransferase RsmD [Clostridia bacterium]